MITEFPFRVLPAREGGFFVADWRSLESGPLKFSHQVYRLKLDADAIAQWLNDRNAGYLYHPHLKEPSC